MPVTVKESGSQTWEVHTATSRWGTCGQSPNSSSTKDVYNAYDYERTEGVQIPNFHKRKRAGELLPHTYFLHYKGSAQAAPGTYNVRNTASNVCTYVENGPWYTNFDWGLTYFNVLDPNGPRLIDTWIGNVDFDSLRQGAAAAIYSKGTDTLTSILELRKQIDSFITLYRGFRRMKEDWRVVMRKKPSDATAAWMEFRYSWRTFIYEVMDYAENLKDFDPERTLYSERVGYTTRRVSVTQNGPLSGADSTRTDTFTDTISVSARGAVSAVIKPPRFAFNPAVTAWELVHLSWLFDWFVNVGQSLRAASFMVLQSEYTASSGFRVEVSRDYSYTTELKANRTGTVSMSNSLSECYVELRNPGSISLTPKLGTELNGEQLLDILHLLRNKLR